MSENTREYRTGQGVPQNGQYICQSGAKATFDKNEKFPVCPISGEEATWTHEDR